MHRLWLSCIGNSPAPPIARECPMEAAEAEVRGSYTDLQRHAAAGGGAGGGIDVILPCVVIRVVVGYLRARCVVPAARVLTLFETIRFVVNRPSSNQTKQTERSTRSTTTVTHPCHPQNCNFAHKTQSCCVLSREMRLFAFC